MELSIFLANRLRKAKTNDGFSGFFNKASTFGIAIAVMVLTIALSVINGFEEQLEKRLLSVIPHIEFITPKQAIDDWPQKASLVAKHQQVIGITPVINMTAMAQVKNNLKGVLVKGVLPNEYDRVSRLGSYTQNGLKQLQNGNVILGKQVAKQLGAKIGDQITLLLPDQQNNGAIAKRERFTLIDIVAMGGPIDQSYALISLNDAQHLTGLTDDQTKGFEIAIKDVFNVQRYLMSIGQLIPDYVYLKTWYTEQGNLYNDIQMVRLIVFITVFLIIAVASFNIVSTLIMEVKEKQSNIAILRTMGAQDSTILGCFIWLGVIQAFVGIGIGLVLGISIALFIPDIYLLLSQIAGKNVLEGVYFIDFLPSKLVLSDIYITVVITLVMAILASYYPAKQASKLDPISLLNH